MPKGPDGQRRPNDVNQLAHKVIRIATGEEEDALPAEGARRGGLAGGVSRGQKLSPERRAEIAKKAALARWKKAHSQ